MISTRTERKSKSHPASLYVAAFLALMVGKIAFSVAAVAMLRAFEFSFAMREPGLLSSLAGHVWLLICLGIVAVFATWINTNARRMIESETDASPELPWQNVDVFTQALIAFACTFVFVDADVNADIERALRIYWDKMPDLLLGVYTDLYFIAVALTGFVAIRRLQ